MTKFTLSTSVMDGETEITELTFRELDVGDLITVQAIEGDVAQIAASLALSADIPFPVFKKIKAKDLKGIMDVNKDILGN